MRLGWGTRLSSGGFLVSNTAELSQQNNAQTPQTPEQTAELQQRCSGRGEAVPQLCCACLQGPREKVMAHTALLLGELFVRSESGEAEGILMECLPPSPPSRSRLGSGAAPCWIRAFGCFLVWLGMELGTWAL